MGDAGDILRGFMQKNLSTPKKSSDRKKTPKKKCPGN